MRLNPISGDVTFQLFLVLVAMAWLAMFWVARHNKSLRRQMFWISAWSFPGGLLVGAWHRTDFWRPPSWLDYPVIRPVFTLEDALFGFFFLDLWLYWYCF